MEGLSVPGEGTQHEGRTRTAPPVLLDPFAARSCPVKTQNRYDATLAGAQGEPDEALLELFAGGKAFEDEVLQAVATVPSVEDLALPDGDGHEPGAQQQVERTLALLSAGVEVVLHPRLPVDHEGHRIGSPDALVRGTDQPDGRPGYLPVEVKRHRVLERSGSPEQPSSFSRLDALSSRFTDVEWTVKPSREGDLLQLAHYWRALDAAGFAAGDTPTAGLVGTDQLALGGDAEPTALVCWVDLTRKVIRTFSRTAATGWKVRSPLERYDHEFGFRVKVAQVAASRTGADDDPRLMVQPIVVRECDHCTWWEACRPQLEADDLSLRINKSPLDVREISALRTHGINTLADLAGTDVDELLTSYLPEVRHRSGAESRLRLAARRAHLMLAGVELERLTQDPIDLPEVSVEVDLDIETSAEDRVYLWGFLVDIPDSGRPPFYKSFARFEDLDNAGECELAGEAIRWLDEVLAERPDGLVYHYSDYEVVHMVRLAQRSGDPEMMAAAKRVRRHFVDMFTLVKQHFFGTHGLGLKAVARSGPGFEWRDEEAGGLNSQSWFDEAVHGDDELVRSEATTRVLEYNEDDVRATHQLRYWLRNLDTEG